ncbi:MAG: preprotein translocase subunit SecE [Pirellulaceae bacterium]|nr:preprotein translocase subunit SecE [Pirellulaceae bacterium]
MIPQGSRARFMGKEKALTSSGSGGWSQLLQGLARADIYKRTQGRITRQLTCLAIWVVAVLAAVEVFVSFQKTNPAVAYSAPAILLVAGLWLGYRIVNLPSFADFLIAVEAEMNKVSWPTQAELVRSSIVVIVLIVGLSAIIFTYDYVLALLLSKILQVTVV